MAQRRTVDHAIGDILRESHNQATPLQARQALADACDFLTQRANWGFLYATKLLQTNAPYTDGTVDGTVGSTTITGTSTVWDATWTLKEIRFQSRQLPYSIASVGGVGTLTLGQNLGGEEDIDDETYEIFQRRYSLPADCNMGRELTLKGPPQHGRNGVIPKKARSLFEERVDEARGSSSIIGCFTDGELDSNGDPTIILDAPPSSAIDLRLTYYKRMVLPTSDSGVILIPYDFQRLPGLLATVRVMRDLNITGWQAKETEAMTMLQDMQDRHTMSHSMEHAGDADYADDGRGPGTWMQDGQMIVRI